MALIPIRERLGEGGFLLSAWSSLRDPEVQATLARAPFDAVTFDMQHGMHDLASIATGISQCVAAGKPAIVRVPVGDLANASRALDLGASAIIMPMVEGPADARAFVEAVKYPPRGRRSFGPARATDLHGYENALGYTAEADRETLSFAMIETASALAALDDILAIDGLDGVFVGPSDLSIALSATGTWNPSGKVATDAIKAIARTAAAAGKIAAIYSADITEARRYRSEGYHLVTISSDVGMLKTAAVALAYAVRSHQPI